MKNEENHNEIEICSILSGHPVVPPRKVYVDLENRDNCQISRPQTGELRKPLEFIDLLKYHINLV